MKKRGLTTLVIAAIVFILDFLTLSNQAFTSNVIANKTGMVITYLAAIAFIIGLVDLIIGLVKKR